MKIVHELNQLDYGGVERVILNIIKYDTVNEHTVLAYKEGPFRKELEKVGAKVVFVAPDSEIDMEADIIHVHTGGGVSPLAKDLGGQFPIVETVHSPVRSAVPNDLVFRRVGVCDAVTRMNSNCQTIKNGIDLENAEPMVDILKSEFDPKGRIVVGRVGRIGTDKGLEEWLLVCYYLQQAGYDIVPLVVGGEASNCDGYIGRLKLMAESLPVKNVVWAGHQDDPRSWYSLIDIFLYPSKTEGFGLVFAEAMMWDCVVVASKTEVTQELFGGYAKLVLPEEGVMGLVGACREVLDNVVLRDEFQGAGREFVESEYQAEEMSHQYQELYNECNYTYPNKPSQDSKTNVVFTR